MRIIYHHRTRGEDAQGIHINELCKAFRALGHDVHMVALAAAKSGGTKQTGDRKPNSLFGIRIPHWLYELMAIAYNLPAFVALTVAVLRYRPDFIYERYAMFTVAGQAVARLFGLPFILEVNAPLSLEMKNHGQLVFQGIARRVEDWLCRHASRVIVVSGPMGTIFSSWGAPADKLMVVPNGVDHQQFHAGVDGSGVRDRWQLQDKFVVGFVGWIRPWHGVDKMIDALSQLRDRLPKLQLLIVGDGPAVPDLKTQAQALGVADRICFTGPVASADVATHVAAMDVTVQPDVTDYASPIKLFEYLAVGKPVIAPRKDNITEIVSEGEQALLYVPGQVDELVEAIEKLYRDDALRTRLGDNAQRLVIERGFNWQTNAGRVIEAVSEDPKYPDPPSSARSQPKLLVFCSLFPSAAEPGAGLFVRERMFRVGQQLPLVVVSPKPWFPFQHLLRKNRPHFRPETPRYEIQNGFRIYRPRFLSLPGYLKWLDGLSMAVCSIPTVWRLRRRLCR